MSAHQFFRAIVARGKKGAGRDGPREIGMAKNTRDDTLKGDFARGKQKTVRSRSRFPLAPIKSTGPRARAAWFNRKTGAGGVKLAVKRDPSRQRVIVKARVVVHAKVKGGGGGGGGGGAGGLMRHTLYVERDGAGREGETVSVFDRELDEARAAEFVDRCEHDRHHFRLILSPEHGEDFLSLKDYTRDLMEVAEKDLGTHLDWIAAEHHDTGRPHVHILMRGVRQDGRDLVIPRDYVSHGFRDRAEELATRELGPRLEQEQERAREAERAAQREHYTRLDQELIARSNEHEISIGDLPDDKRRRALLVQRLNQLEAWNLAERQAADRWRLDRELRECLDRWETDIARFNAAARMLAKQDLALDLSRSAHLEQAHSSVPFVGRLVGWESLTKDERGPQLIGIETIDGKFMTARVASVEHLRALDGVEIGAIIRMKRSAPDLKPSDRTILEVAGEDRVYSAERHREMVPSDSEKYIEMHVRRLEALRREGIVERSQEGEFFLAPDHETRVRRHEGRGGRESARIELLDPRSIETQIEHEGPTWLDRMASHREDRNLWRLEGFGKEASDALKSRFEVLEELGLGQNTREGFAPEPSWYERLQEMELEATLERIERDTGRVAHFARDGDIVEGLYKERIRTGERSHGLIEHDRTATLVPWRPEMDRALNQYVSGEVNGRDFNFDYGREVQERLQRELSRGYGLEL